MYYNDVQLHKEIESLPQELQAVIKSLDIADIISNIGLEKDLLIGEIGSLYDETKKVVVGETRPENFVEKIKDVLEDEKKSKATDIANEINTKILVPIRNAFQRISMQNLVPDPFKGGGTPTPENAPIRVPQPIITEDEKKPLSPYETYGDEHGTYDKEHLLREIESPTPPEITTAFQNAFRVKSPSVAENPKKSFEETTAPKPEVPENLPIGEETDKITPPILRTMKGDLSGNKNDGIYQISANLPGRGKFGTGVMPSVNQRPISSMPPPPPPHREETKLIVPKPPQENIKKENPLTPPSHPLSEGKKPELPQVETKSAFPQVLTPRSVPFVPPQKISSPNDISGDKINKTVNVPSERKNYVIDPYREPVE